MIKILNKLGIGEMYLNSFEQVHSKILNKKSKVILKTKKFKFFCVLYAAWWRWKSSHLNPAFLSVVFKLLCDLLIVPCL
jgi:hypothetical protein